MTPFSIIVAFDQHYGIGIANALPWRLKGDLKHFKTITTTVQDPQKQNAVIMGKNTWLSLPDGFRPLAGRQNIVLTRQSQFKADGAKVCSSFEDALMPDPKIESYFVIGGAELYKQAIVHPACVSLYVTHVKGHFNCDAFFPAFGPQFMLISAGEMLEEGSVTYQFCHYMKHR